MAKGKTNPKDSQKRRQVKPDTESEEPEVKPNPRRNLLCFDSGGALSLSSLMVLDRLLEQFEKDDISKGRGKGASRKPYEYFDMIGGTGTGGLLAIMLGRLKMGIADCIDEFHVILKDVYRDMDPNNYPALKSKDQDERAEAWENFATQNSEKMERAAKNLVKKYGGDENLTFFDESESLCEVFVCSLVANTSGLVPLTTYQTLRATKRRLKSIKVWEAIRATTATPTYFEPISIVSEHYTEVLLSGEVGAANPIQMLWNEGKRKFELTDPLVPLDPLIEDEEPREIEDPGEDRDRDLGVLISIGSGLPHLYSFETQYDKVMESAYHVATDAESITDAFQHSNLTLDYSQRYIRLNVLQGLAHVEFYDATKDKVKDILKASSNYVDKAEFLKVITRAVNITKHRPQRETFDQIAEQMH